VFFLADFSVFQLVGGYPDKFQGSSCGPDQLHGRTQAGDSESSGQVPSEASRRQVGVLVMILRPPLH